MKLIIRNINHPSFIFIFYFLFSVSLVIFTRDHFGVESFGDFRVPRDYKNYSKKSPTMTIYSFPCGTKKAKFIYALIIYIFFKNANALPNYLYIYIKYVFTYFKFSFIQFNLIKKNPFLQSLFLIRWEIEFCETQMVANFITNMWMKK